MSVPSLLPGGWDTGRESRANEGEGALTAHRLQIFCSCTVAFPCQYSEAGSLCTRFWKSCQARRRIRRYTKVNGQMKRLGLGSYQIASPLSD